MPVASLFLVRYPLRAMGNKPMPGHLSEGVKIVGGFRLFSAHNRLAFNQYNLLEVNLEWFNKNNLTKKSLYFLMGDSSGFVVSGKKATGRVQLNTTAFRL